MVVVVDGDHLSTDHRIRSRWCIPKRQQLTGGPNFLHQLDKGYLFVQQWKLNSIHFPPPIVVNTHDLYRERAIASTSRCWVPTIYRCLSLGPLLARTLYYTRLCYFRFNVLYRSEQQKELNPVVLSLSQNWLLLLNPTFMSSVGYAPDELRPTDYLPASWHLIFC